MMNRSSSSSNPPDPYVPSSSTTSMIMSFDNGQNVEAQQQNQQQLQGLEKLYWDHSAQQNQTPNYNFDPQPPLPLPLSMKYTTNNCFQFYEQYQPTAMNTNKREDQGARIGLNLGHRTYFSSADALAIDRLLSARAQQQQQQQQQRGCQVEGCMADLSGAKHYHRRHKVCEFHSKATVVTAAGMQQQRFCQQCSRFHVLGEFDEYKRSCRKRLADHNRRRRKAQNPTSLANTTTSPSSSKTSPEYTISRSIAKTSISTEISSDNGGGFHVSKKKAVDNRGGGMGSDHNQSLYQYQLQQQQQQQQQQQDFSGTSTSNKNSSSSSYFYHHSLFGSSSNDSSRSTTMEDVRHQL